MGGKADSESKAQEMIAKSKSPWMPSFETIHKYMARELHIGYLYPLLTGNLDIPTGLGYWYLCNEQSGEEGSEIHQLTKKRSFGDKDYHFAQMDQCYGVDRNPRIIKKNRKLNPHSHWLASEWNAAIQDQTLFKPSLVYLDTTSFADKSPAAEALKETLLRCKKNTLVVANVMMNNARAGEGNVFFDKDALVDNLIEPQHPLSFSGWNVSPDDPNESLFHSYEYKTSKTLMRSYIFFKGVLPPTELMIVEFEKFKNWCSELLDLSEFEKFKDGCSFSSISKA